MLIRGLPNITTVAERPRSVHHLRPLHRAGGHSGQHAEARGRLQDDGAELSKAASPAPSTCARASPSMRQGLHINGNVRGVYSDKSKETDPDLGLTLSDTWDVGAGDFGVLVGASYHAPQLSRGARVQRGADRRLVSKRNRTSAARHFPFNAAHPAARRRTSRGRSSSARFRSRATGAAPRSTPRSNGARTRTPSSTSKASNRLQERLRARLLRRPAVARRRRHLRRHGHSRARTRRRR